MAKPKTEINPISKTRLAGLLLEARKSQTDLAKMIDLSEVYMSRIMCGKAPLTEKLAKKIAEAFSGTGIRFEWLMGYDDCKTKRKWELERSVKAAVQQAEKLVKPANRRFDRYSVKIRRLSTFLQLQGYETDPPVDGLVSDEIVEMVEQTDSLVQVMASDALGLIKTHWDEMDKVYEDQVFTLYQIVKDGRKPLPQLPVRVNGQGVTLEEWGQISGTELLQFADELEDYAGVQEDRLFRLVSPPAFEKTAEDLNENDTEEST